MFLFYALPPFSMIILLDLEIWVDGGGFFFFSCSSLMVHFLTSCHHCFGWEVILSWYYSSLNVMHLFLLLQLRLFSSFFWSFCMLMIVCLGVFFFVFILHGFHWASWIYKLTFLKIWIWKYFIHLSLKYFFLLCSLSLFILILPLHIC